MKDVRAAFSFIFVVVALLCGCRGVSSPVGTVIGKKGLDNTTVEEGAGEETDREVAGEENSVVNNLKVNLLKVTPVDTGEKKIVAVSINFETKKETAVTLSTDEGVYTSEGVFHSFAVAVRVPTESFRYSITIDNKVDSAYTVGVDDENGEEECDMFWSVGDISSDLSIFVPIMNGVKSRHWPYCGKLRVYLFARLENRETFDKNVIFTFEEQTPAEMLASVDAQYQKHKADLMRAWPILSEEELRAVFIFNVVGNMWHLGNYVHRAAPGCVTVNEEIAPEDGDYIEAYADDGTPIYFRWKFYDMPFFLKSRIGCCTDHAYIQRLLFEAAGLTTRRMVTPGHWYAEAVIDGGWYTFDASYGVIVTSAIEDMVNADEKTAYIFVLPYMDEGWPVIFPFGIMDTLGVGWDMPVTDEYMYLYYRLIPGDM